MSERFTFGGRERRQAPAERAPPGGSRCRRGARGDGASSTTASLRTRRAAVIESATTPEQWTAVATLETIADVAVAVEPPALVVVGEVVALADRLAAHDLIRSAAAA